MEPINLLSESVENFNVDFYKNSAANFNDNFVCSALSAYVVLAMATFGAKGNTALQMRNALYMSENEASMLNVFQNFITELNDVENDGVILKLANKIFASKKIAIKESYKELISSYFHSGIDQLDFSKTEEAVKVVNDWCAKQTNDKIKQLIEPGDINEGTAMLLLNAVYFKSNWKYQFDKRDTQPKTFYLSKDSKIEVPTMHLSEYFHFGTLDDLDAQYIELPYKNEDLTMLIIIPREIDGLSKIEKNLEKISLNYTQNLSTTFKRKTKLYLPKFKIETTLSLEEGLKQLGMTDMFDEKHADFQKMTDTPVVVNKAIQKVFIEVNEQGSEAAAATVVEAVFVQSLTDETNVHVDRPFLFRIFDKKRNVFLFSGRVSNPLMS